MSLKFDVKSVISGIKPRRAILYAPSMETKKLEKASQLKELDTVAFDLEDGVPTTKKALARKNIVEYLNKQPKIVPELAVRINNVDSEDCALDLNEVMLDPVASKRIQTIIIPKVEDPEEVRYIARWLRLNKSNHAKILAMIETPLGLTRAAQICASSSKVDGVIFGAEDYRAAAGIQRGAIEPIQYARSAIVAAARAAHIQAIDMTSVNFKDPEVVTKEALSTRSFGFTGKQVIHPMQIACVNKAFTPDEKEIKACKEMITKFVITTYLEGKGVFGSNGQMVELPHIADCCRRLMLAGLSVEQIQEIADAPLKK